MVRFHPLVELGLAANLTDSPSSWSWTDYTHKVRNPSSISITRGRSGRYTQTPPASCALEFINNGGLFVPSNPLSALYGQIGINTPLRVSMRPDTNAASDTFTRSSASSWGTATVGGAWTINGPAGSDFSVNSTFARHTNTAASQAHYSVLAATMIRSDITVRVRVNALSTGAPQTVACVSRYGSSGANVNRVELRFGTDQSLSLRIAQRVAGVDTLGTSFTVSGLTHSTASWYWMRVQIGRTSARARVWLDGTDQPRDWDLDGTNGLVLFNTAAGQCGVYSIRETGNTNANATLDFDDYTLVDGPRIQFTGFVDQWPTTWADASGRQSFAGITATGVLRRIAEAPATRSALVRAHTTDTYADEPETVAYWPLEDKGVSRQFASAVGGPAMVMSGFTPSSDSGFVGSEALPVAGSTAGAFSGAVRAYVSPSPNQWSVRCVCKFPTAVSANSAWLVINTTGVISRWQIINGPGTPDVIELQAFTGLAAEVLGSGGSNFVDTLGNELYGKNLYVAVSAAQNGTNIDWSLDCTFIDVNGRPSTLSTSGSVAGTLGNVGRVSHVGGPGFTTGGYTFGHVAVGRLTTFGPTGDDAISGYYGEITADRFNRLLFAEDLSPFVGEITTGTFGTSEQLMGPLDGTTLQAQLQQIESTEEGILFDGKQGQLTLLPRSMRYNHAVNLDLDVSAGEVGWPFNPVDDTFLLRNDVTASSPAGSSARAIATGDFAPSRVGAKSDPVTVNAPDVDLADHANWRMRLGTTAELRYPQIVLNFGRAPQLVEDWLDTDIGGRLQITNVPDVLDPTPVDLLVEGYTEVISRTSWVASLNCSPASPWNAFTWENTTNLGRHGTHGSYLMSAYSSAVTSMRFATSASPYGISNTRMWSTTAEPYDVGAGGERLTVTNMATNAATFVAAGTAQHADNAAVTPGMPAGVQQDDLLLVFAMIRSSGTGTIVVPSGYTALATSGNVVLLGKIHSGTESAPSIAPSGGAAGDTVSAQMASFRNCQAVVMNSADQLNGSTANVAYPALHIARDRCVVLYLAWKQTTWTSVAAISGATEIGDVSTATGNDQAFGWDYLIQTTCADIAAGSFAVTGGVSAISRGMVVALAGDVQTATVTRHVNGVTKAQAANAAVSLWRPGRIAL